MYEEDIENLKDSVEEEDNRDELAEQLAEGQGFDGAPDTDDKITYEELLNHCRCHIVEGHMHWLCDREVYRDCLAGLLEKEPVIELETNWSLDEGSFL